MRGDFDLYDNLLLLVCKLNHFAVISRPYQSNFIEPTEENVDFRLVYRGALDVIIWVYSMLREMDDMRFRIKDSFIEDSLLSTHIPLILTRAITYLQRLKFVLLIGSSKETAKNRRNNDNSLINSTIYDNLYDWYGHLAVNVLGNLNKNFGTGYMILNGEEDPLLNALIIRNYLKRNLGWIE